MQNRGRKVMGGLGRAIIVAALFAAGVAQTKSATAVKSPPPGLAGPPSPLRHAREFAGCKWTTVRAGALSIGTFTCGPKHGDQRLVGDAALPGFWLETRNDGKTQRSLAVQVFTKPAHAQIESILGAVRKVSPGAQTVGCALVLAPVEGGAGSQRQRYVFEPTGAAKTAWESGKTGDSEPCGRLGVAEVGDRYFEVLAQHPDMVVFTDMGSEIQIFDPDTLKVAATR